MPLKVFLLLHRFKTSVFAAIYQDRWPMDQITLSAKQMVRTYRQFVNANERIQRLPELALPMGSFLTFLRATARVAPTNLWDSHQKRTPRAAS